MNALNTSFDRIRTAARLLKEFFEDQWFDRTRRVRTGGNVSLAGAGIEGATPDSEWYQPARPQHIRAALRGLPVQDWSRYSYVDLGSGKGRTLFVAAELPFREVIGVELSERLHAQAARNCTTFRRGRQGCGEIRSVHANVLDFDWPQTPLVLYLFNPFGESTMRQVLARLERSLQQQPRHVLVVLLWPKAGHLVAAVPGMKLIQQNSRLQVFEAGAE